MRRLDPVKHEERRQEILAAAHACFLREGLRGTSISDICAEAGMSPGHLYHYFSSKEEILDAIYTQAVTVAAQQFGEMIQHANALVAISAVIDDAKIRGNRADFLLFLEIAADSERNAKLGKMLREGSRNTRSLMAAFLRAGQQSGLVDPALSAEAVAAVLFAILDGVRMMIVRDPKIQMAEILDHLRIMVTRFLLPPSTPSPSP